MRVLFPHTERLGWAPLSSYHGGAIQSSTREHRVLFLGSPSSPKRAHRRTAAGSGGCRPDRRPCGTVLLVGSRAGMQCCSSTRGSTPAHGRYDMSELDVFVVEQI